jgi:hypothetical protein
MEILDVKYYKSDFNTLETIHSHDKRTSGIQKSFNK